MSGSKFIPICGYMVVRKAQMDIFDPRDPLRYGRPAPPRQVSGTWYNGACREDWADLIEPYYRCELPREIFRDYDPIAKQNLERTCFHVTRDLEVARRLLMFCRAKNDFNELIAINVERLTDTSNCVYASDQNLDLLGYDLVLLGGWSILGDGYFLFPEAFKKWSPFINGNGLFNANAPFYDYVAAYSDASARGITEPVVSNSDSSCVDIVAVYRLAEAAFQQSNCQ